MKKLGLFVFLMLVCFGLLLLSSCDTIKPVTLDKNIHLEEQVQLLLPPQFVSMKFNDSKVSLPSFGRIFGMPAGHIINVPTGQHVADFLSFDKYYTVFNNVPLSLLQPGRQYYVYSDGEFSVIMQGYAEYYKPGPDETLFIFRQESGLLLLIRIDRSVAWSA